MVKERTVRVSTGEYRVREIDTRTLLALQERPDGDEILNGIMLGDFKALLTVLASIDGCTTEELETRLATANDLTLVEKAFRELNADFFEMWATRTLAVQQALAAIQESVVPQAPAAESRPKPKQGKRG